MIAGANGNYIGLLSFLAFSLSVIAAVLAIDMYTLLRTGEFGKTWRVLIIASVMFALVQALRMAEFLDWGNFNEYGLSQIAELMFALSLAYAFFLQRKAFHDAFSLRRTEEGHDIEEEELDDTHQEEELSRDDGWSRLSGSYREADER